MNAMTRIAVLVGAGVAAIAPATAAHASGPPHISLNDGSGWTRDATEPLFDLSDIAPGWSSTATVSVRNDGGAAAALILKSSNIVDNENGCDHPESIVDSTCSGDDAGELGHEMTFAVFPQDSSVTTPIWQGTLYDLEQGVMLADTVEPNAIDTYRIEAQLPYSSGNETQTDTVGFGLRWTLSAAGSSSTVAVKGAKFIRTPRGNVVQRVLHSLPFTGSDIGRLLGGSLGLVCAGAALTMLARTSRRPRAD